MPKLKENLALISILLCCVILFYASSILSDNKNDNIQKDAIENIIQNDKDSLNLFKDKWSYEKTFYDNENTDKANDSDIDNKSNNEEFKESIILSAPIKEVNEQLLSITSVLLEVGEISEQLKLELENIKEQECSTCDQEYDFAPTCATILAGLSGGCDCSTLGCTPPIGPWCVHPCCCVCCSACCR